MLAFVFSFAPYPFAVVLMEAIGWSGLAHLVATTTRTRLLQQQQNAGEDHASLQLTVCADADDAHGWVMDELRNRFADAATTTTTTPPIPRHIRL